MGLSYFLKILLTGFREEGVREGERMHSSVGSYMCPGGEPTQSRGGSGQCSNHLGYLARVCLPYF